MQDLLFVIIVLGFFAVATGVIRLCDRVVGATDAPKSTDQATTQEARTA